MPSIFPQQNVSTTSNQKQTTISRYERKKKRESAKTTQAHVTRITKSAAACNLQEISDAVKDAPQVADDLHDESHNLQIERGSLLEQKLACEQELSEWKEKFAALEKKNETEKVECQMVIDDLRNNHLGKSLKANSVTGNDAKCKQLTGLSWQTFEALYEYLKPAVPYSFELQGKLPVKDQLFVTLVKLRQNPTIDLLAHILGIARSTFVEMFAKWLNILHAKIGFLVHWPDREVMFKTVPPHFKAKYPRLTCIVDCFEIRIENPTLHKPRAQTYSNYKKSTTVKFFIACHPAGSISYLSPAWGGRASDVEIVRKSDFMTHKHFLPGDQILADRGFTLYDDFAVRVNAELITPEFMKGRSQMPAKEVEKSRTISNVRIHIERVIGILKNRYHILDGPMPLRFIKSLRDEAIGNTKVAVVDKIVNVCAALVNMEGSVVYNEK